VDEHLELAALLRLGRVESLLGGYEHAAERYDRALQIATSLGDRTNEANSLRGLRRIAAARGANGDARRVLERAATLFRQLRQPDATHATLALIGELDEPPPAAGSPPGHVGGSPAPYASTK